MYTPLTKEQFDSAIKAGFTPEKIIENEKKRKALAEESPGYNAATQPVQENSFLSKIGSTAKTVLDKITPKILSGGNPAIEQVFKTSVGKNLTNKVLTTGAKNLKEATKPFVQPFAMVSGKDIPALGVKANPTPGEAFGESISAALWVLPVEKVLAPVLKPVGKFLGGFAERMAGVATGKGTGAISAILDNPKAALEGLQGNEVKILQQNATEARNAVINLDRTFKADYAQALEELPKRLGALPQVLTDNLKTTIKVGGKTYVLSKQGIKAGLTNVLRDVGVSVDRAKNFLDFSQSPLTEAEGTQIKKVWNLINDWVDTTPKGLNNLAVKIDKFKRNAPGNEVYNQLVGKVKNGIRDYMGEIIPAIKEMNDKYASSANTVEKLREILDVPNNFKNPETLIAVAKKMQNFFVGNKQLEQELFKTSVTGGQEMISREAGRLVGQSPSRASASIGDTVKNLFQTVISPKAIGELVAYTGIAAEKIKPVIEVIQKLAPAERQVLFNLFKAPEDTR